MTYASLGLAVAFLLGCGGGCDDDAPKDGALPTPGMSPIVFERDVWTTILREGNASQVYVENEDLNRAFLFLPPAVRVPSTVPLGRHAAVFSGDSGTRADGDIFVLDSSRPSMLHLYRNEISLNFRFEAAALTITPPGPTTIEFELPEGVTPRLSGTTWQSTTTPYDVGTERHSLIGYALEGNLPIGRYPFKMLWKRGSDVLAEAPGTIVVEGVANLIRLYNPRSNAPSATEWSFPDNRIERAILPLSTRFSVTEGGRTLTMVAQKPLPPGQYFVPTDLLLEYRQGANVYEGAYGYVIIEENSEGRLSLRIREMSMMAAEGTPQGYFSLDGIVRRRF